MGCLNSVYKIKFNKSYLKELECIPKRFQKSIQEKIAALAVNPRPIGSQKLQGAKTTPLYRIRCGDYRVVYSIEDFQLIIIIVEVGHRREIYR